MEQDSPIILYVDGFAKDDLLSWTEDEGKLKANFAHFDNEFLQEIEIKKALYADDVVSVTVLGHFICILHTATVYQRMVWLDVLGSYPLEAAHKVISRLFNEEVASDFTSKYKWLKTHPPESFYPVELRLERF
ncbi:hypothetical protein [Pedobacter aquatilis]|uniref:hypothetical protein n=1 Tax=Pedobacter aquatilis TaxID=351343 RepID=UPI00292EC258|nr:hypothetical protein [Pedobacter aquatilis]